MKPNYRVNFQFTKLEPKSILVLVLGSDYESNHEK